MLRLQMQLAAGNHEPSDNRPEIRPQTRLKQLATMVVLRSKKNFHNCCWKSPHPTALDPPPVAQTLLSKTTGFLGMGERGVGGSKCGATAANVSLYLGADGATQLLTSNIGDARILLIRGGKPVQLSEDHVPDSEAERKRIERTNPNPKNVRCWKTRTKAAAVWGTICCMMKVS